MKKSPASFDSLKNFDLPVVRSFSAETAKGVGIQPVSKVYPESVVRIWERLFRADEIRGARRIFAVNRTYGS